MTQWMIYGANGYSGNLIAREAHRQGLKPIIAGRNRDAVRALGEELGLEARVFDCATVESVRQALQGVTLVLHCAGPFSKTSAIMLEGCLLSKTHYLDITGEISVFEAIHKQSARIRAAGITAIPGVGFDVVPSDCLAALLKEKMPDATTLSLAFKASGGISPGTAKTMVEGLGIGGAIRKQGKICVVPAAYAVREIDYGKRVQPSVTIGWGDVSTAFYSTGIPNIQVYLASSRSAIRRLRVMRYLRRPLGSPVVQKILKKSVDRWVKGPAEESRASGYCSLWGEVVNHAGKKQVLRLRTPEAYTLTMISALAAVKRVLVGDIELGAITPSRAFGNRFVLDIPGVSLSE